MSDIYVNVDYEEYKALEQACREFVETSHGEGTEYYHKSFRFPLNKDTTVEIHGPLVKARQTTEEGQCLHPFNQVEVMGSGPAGTYPKCRLCGAYVGEDA